MGLCQCDDLALYSFHLHCDLDREHSNPIFSLGTFVYDDLPSDLEFYILNLQSDLDHEHSNSVTLTINTAI